jgi:hypothetical protein
MLFWTVVLSRVYSEHVILIFLLPIAPLRHKINDVNSIFWNVDFLLVDWKRYRMG